MKERLTAIRLKMLFLILHSDDLKITAASIAKSLHISKSTVTRAVEFFEGEGILMSGQLKFTSEGKKFIEELYEKKDALTQWLEAESDLNHIHVEEEAFALLLNTKQETLDSILKNTSKGSKNCTLCEIDGFCDRCIDYLLDDGEYSIAFTIYKRKLKTHMQASMANDGFYHPGTLKVKDGVGSVLLMPKKVIRQLPVGKGLIAGKVDKFSYLKNHQFEKAEFDGTYWRFPITGMKFTYNKGEGILTGTTTLKLGCTAGKIYMPESIAVFSMILSL